MEFSIRLIVVILVILVAFVIIIALLTGWGGNASIMSKSFADWLNSIMPKSSSNIPLLNK